MFANAGSRAGRGRHGYGVVYYDICGNVIGGEGAGAGLGPGRTPSANGNNIALGAGSGAALVPMDYGNVFVGRAAGGLNTQGGATGYNTCVGDGAGYNGFAATTAVSYRACTAIGRSAGAGWTTDSYNVAIGHGAMFKGGGSVATIAIGGTAAGMAVDGSATNWDGAGRTYWGAINDTNVTYIGQSAGKASVAGRTNCFALGSLAQIPIKDNTGAIGHALTDISSAARGWFGMSLLTDSSGASTSHAVSAANLMAGFLTRSGSAASGVADTTDTAANIVAAGPGNSCEVPVGRLLTISNLTTQTITVVAGSGVTVSGFAQISYGAVSMWLLIVTNSTAGSEAVTLQRLGT